MIINRAMNDKDNLAAVEDRIIIAYEPNGKGN
jgi:hypothetical protein